MNKMKKDAKILSSCEVTKIKQGMSYSCKEKTIIMNVFKYFCSQYTDKNITEIVRLTSKATGCSEKSIFSFRKEEVSPEGFREPSKTKVRKKVNTNNRLVKYNEGTQEQIKRIIYDLKAKNISPSLNVILRHLSSNNDIPKFSLMTLRRLLSDMGFYYEKNGSKSILVEKVDCKKSSDMSGHITQRVLPLNSTLSEEPATENSESNAQISSVANNENDFNASSTQPKRTILSGKIGSINVQPYVQHHNTYRSHENVHGDNFFSKAVHAPTQVPTPFAHRMLPNQFLQQDHFELNKDRYLKEVQSVLCYPTSLGPHSTTMQ